jgi:3-oxoacyl-[acyl-carrier-protein] synthase II
MNERVLITGVSCISCFGIGPAAFIDAILSGRSGTRPISRFDTTGCTSHRAAEVCGFDPLAFIAPLKLRRIDAVGRLALAGARLVLEDAFGPVAAGGRGDIGIAIGTSTAGLDSLAEYLDGLSASGPNGVPAILFSNTVQNAPASLCAIEFGLHGPNVTFNQREASSVAALAYGAGAIRQGRTAAMIAGGVDSVEETFFRVHDRLRALSPLRNAISNDETARPFDRARNGSCLGEGAFLLLIESASAANARGARVYGEILGIGATASKSTLNGWPEDSEGLAAAMRLALDDANLPREQVAAVIGTANGSPTLDLQEATAVASVFGPGFPVASIKGAVGESGAAGTAGIIAGLLSMDHGVLSPTAGLVEADPVLDIVVSAHRQPVRSATFMVNSVAIGGTSYSVVISATSPLA